MIRKKLIKIRIVVLKKIKIKIKIVIIKVYLIKIVIIIYKKKIAITKIKNNSKIVGKIII